MERIWDTENRQMMLEVSIKCYGKCRFRVVAEDFKPFSKYVDRTIEVEGYRTVELKFPVTPKRMKIHVIPLEQLSEKKDYIVDIKEKKLLTYNIFEDDNTVEFLKLAVPFCRQAGFLPTNPRGRIYSTPERRFNFRLYPVIRDVMTGAPMNTPARIGHQTGIIDVSQMKYRKYTFPMKMIISLHEFSHKWKNPKIGLPINHEMGADINALYIYLGKGFSKVDAIYVFANVFYGAQTDENIARMKKIMEYIKRFEAGEFAQKN